jgi:hypothetical protein
VTSKATTLAGIIPRGANVLINSDFRINQRGQVSAAALAAGIYGHDRWKAGASGGDYSFAQLASSTQITIASGKSLIQVVEDKNVEGGGYVLSWTGTAQARAGVNSATPSGSYSASPLIITGQTAGAVMSVEFNAGTLGKVKLELGSVPTPFVMGDYEAEVLRCQRYCQKIGFNIDTAPSNGVSTSQFIGAIITSTIITTTVRFFRPMRTTPSITFFRGLNGTTNGQWALYNGSWVDTASTIINTSDPTQANIGLTFAALTIGQSYTVQGGALLNSEL